MSYPFSSSHKSQDPPNTSSPTSTLRNARVQQSVWGSSNPQQTSRRGLTPLATAQSSTQQRSGTSSPSRNPLSPTNSGFGHPQSRSQQVSSRHSSVSSQSSLFSPLGPTGAQSSSSRQRNLTSSGSPHLPSSASAFSSLDRAGGGSGGGTARFTRQSPSLSGSTAGSPVPFSGPSNTGGSGQLTSLVITQLNILLSTLKEDKDKTKWEAQAEKIWKVRIQSCACVSSSVMLTDFV